MHEPQYLLEVRRPWWVNGEENELWPLSIHSNAYEKSRVIKTGPGKLYGFTVYSSNVAAQFIQLYDAAILPANGATPWAVFTVSATANLGVSYGTVGATFN